jgi:integral membrane protein
VFRTPLSLFRSLAIAEMFSWTLLIAGLILRAIFDWRLAVTVGGAIHGFVFLAYAAAAILVAVHQRWRFATGLLAVGSAVVPYATLPTELWLSRTGRLAGPWRLAETDDPRDRRLVDRWLRFVLRRAWAFGAVAVLVVVAVYLLLLAVGPPGR